jgi:hypothetical protein
MILTATGKKKVRKKGYETHSEQSHLQDTFLKTVLQHISNFEHCKVQKKKNP